MVLSFGAGEQFTGVVVTEPALETQGSRLGPVGPRGRGTQHLVEANPQRGVHNLLERLSELGRALPCFRRDIGIERQRGSHAGIMML